MKKHSRPRHPDVGHGARAVIIKGRSAGNVSFWSQHLLRVDTNERAEIKEARGVVAQDLQGALREMQAFASASRCGPNFMYQANINPQAHEHLTPEQWTQAIDRLEKNLGFEGHQRVVVEHEKEGRAHRHVIWCRVDEEFRTVSPFFNYLTHERTARELEREFGLEQLVENGRARETIQLWEQQRGEQTKIDPRQVKAEVTELWRATSSGQELREALEGRGYILAKGDRRDFVIVDHAGTAHSLARRIEGVRAADVRERMADIDRETLPSVEEARFRQRERFLDAAGAWKGRLKENGQTGSNADGMDWTERGGMAAQQRAAIEEVQRRSQSAREPDERTARSRKLADMIKDSAAKQAQRDRDLDGGHDRD